MRGEMLFDMSPVCRWGSGYSLGFGDVLNSEVRIAFQVSV